jgi:hypothetical protein
MKLPLKFLRALCLKDVGYVVDKLHIKGHIGKNCKKFCHPDNFPPLKLLNTVVCEQKNFWLGNYKYSLKHMGTNRFNFFVFITVKSHILRYVLKPGCLNLRTVPQLIGILFFPLLRACH